MSSEGGVIHDIGYRSYTGQRLGPDYVARSLYVHSVRGAYGLGRSTKSKVMPWTLVVAMIAPALVIASVVNVLNSNELPLDYTSYAVRLQLVTVVFLASQAPQSVSTDLRFRVVDLYFARPLRRSTYVGVKVLAMATALFLLMAVPLLVLYVGALLAKMPFWTQTGGLFLGVVGAAIFAIVLASIGVLVAALTPRRGLGVAAVVTVLLVLAGVSGALQGIAFDEGALTWAGYGGLVSPFSLVDGVQVWLFHAESSTVIGPPGTTGGLIFAAAALLVVVACWLLLIRRYRSVAVL